MADSTLAAMTADTDPATTSLLYLVEDPSGTPLNRKITAANLLVVTKNMTEDTAPDRAADFVATYDTSASGPKKVLLNNLGVYSIACNVTNVSPADATTYFFGNWDGSALSTGAGGSRRMYIQRAGKITKADVFMAVASPGSNETSTMSVRVNNSTDTTISSSIEALPFMLQNLLVPQSPSDGGIEILPADRAAEDGEAVDRDERLVSRRHYVEMRRIVIVGEDLDLQAPDPCQRRHPPHSPCRATAALFQ